MAAGGPNGASQPLPESGSHGSEYGLTDSDPEPAESYGLIDAARSTPATCLVAGESFERLIRTNDDLRQSS